MLLVRVVDGEASQALRDLLVPPGARIDDLTRARVAARAGQGGWRLVGVERGDPDREGTHRTWTLEREGGRARVVLFDADHSSEHEGRSQTHGVAELEQGLDTLAVEVHDLRAARATLAALP